MTRWAHHTPVQRNWLFNFYLLRNLSWKQKVSTESINTYLVQISLLLIPVPDLTYLFLLQVWRRELIFVEYVKCARKVQIHPNWLLHHEDAVISAKYGHLVEQIVLDLWEYLVVQLKVLTLLYAICGFQVFRGHAIHRIPSLLISQWGLQVDPPLVLSLWKTSWHHHANTDRNTPRRKCQPKSLARGFYNKVAME